MKNWIFYVCVAIVATYATSSLAQEHKHEGSGGDQRPQQESPLQNNQQIPAQVQQWPGFFNCGQSQFIMDGVQRDGQIPMIKATGILTIPGAEGSGQATQMIQTQMVQDFNPSTLTFAVVSHLTNGYSCVILFGSQMAPASNGHDTRSPKAIPDDETLKEKMKRIPPIDPRDIKILHDTKGEMRLSHNII
jgi:hypothetical protein